MPADSRPLVAEISSHDITIHTAFEGTELMLFGARNDPGDIVVVVRGPQRDATVWRKERMAGIWVNKTSETFDKIPVFYALASSRPFEEIKKSIYFNVLGVDSDSALAPFVPGASAVEHEAEYQQGLLRFLREEGLYSAKPGKVEFIGSTLFKVSIPFPETTPRGLYTAEAYLFSDGELIATQTTPIKVYKTGFDAAVYHVAHDYPHFYAFFAIGMAALLGMGANFLFQRT